MTFRRDGVHRRAVSWGRTRSTSVTLTSAGAAPYRHGYRQPVPRSRRPRPSGPASANYAISYVNGALTVTPAALTITANDRTKVYGQTVVFAGTEFTASGLLNADSADERHAHQRGRRRRPQRSPAARTPITAAPRRSARVSPTTRSPTSMARSRWTSPALTITADDATKTYGDTVTFAGTEFTTNWPGRLG